ncbi:MAG: pyridoxamine 5'-phosphate oxidase family protein [Anaerolineae bacterium]|nr:pyridoxamine 5'-phosphate oxidase family protein [Anaerolineae bacterium]
MAQFYTTLDDKLSDFIAAQKMFFVATAPVEGRINLSPKGMDTFQCLDHKTVAYLDLTGSGNETAAHLAENERMTLMFCSFDQAPLILRLYGQGRVIHKQDPAWADLAPRFPALPGTRQIILLEIDSVQTSCGFAVPFYAFQGERDTLRRYAETKGEAGMAQYRREQNQISIDGLPTGLPVD